MALLLLAFPAALAGCGVELEHDLDERQANQVSSVLESAGIPTEKVSETGSGDHYKVIVPRSEATRAFQLLEARDLPRRGERGIAETFGSSSFLPSAVEERARYSAALSTDLERTLEGVPGIVTARVHLALPAEEPLVGDTAHQRPTAAVLLKTRAALAITDSDVRRLVAGSVHDLQTADVNVVVALQGAEAPPPDLDRLGPLRVARESRSTAAALAISGLVLILLLGLAVALVAFRVGALRRRLRELGKD